MKTILSIFSIGIMSFLHLCASANENMGSASSSSIASACPIERINGKVKQTAGIAVRPIVPPVQVSCGGGQLTATVPPVPEKSGNSSKDASNGFDWNALIHDLIWPVVLLTLAFLFRPAIVSLMKQPFKFKYGDAEMEFIGKQANESLSKIVYGTHLGSLNIDAIFESVRFNDWATLVISRMLMRKGLINIVGNGHGLGDSPSLEKLLNLCRTSQLLPFDQIDELERLREVTYFAEWWGGRRPTRGEWKWALKNCQAVVERLFDSDAVA